MGKASRKKKEKQADTPAAIVQTPSRAFPWWVIAALCLVAFLTFAQTLSFDFVFDDSTQILRNSWIRDWSQVSKFFLTDVWSYWYNEPGNYYRPLHMLIHAAGYAISGLKPYGFHLINVLLHCLSTVLVALAGYRLTRNRVASAAGGFIFALHPVHAESVSWIAGVTDPLCAVFYFGAIYVHLNEGPSSEKKQILLTSFLFLGALFSKEMAFTLPLIFVWLDLCLRRKFQWSRYAALVATFGVYTLFRVNALHQFNVTQRDIPLGLHDRLLSSMVLLGEYLAKAFVPFNINAFHVFHPTTAVLDTRFLLSALVILAFAWAAWVLRHDRQVLSLVGFIPLSLLPILNISGIGENVFADRYLYIPSLGSCLLIPLLARNVSRMKAVSGRVPERTLVICTAGAVCLLFAIVVHNTTFMWRDDITLYEETMKRSPDASSIASNLARCHFEAGRLREAEEWTRRSEDTWKKSFIKSKRDLLQIYTRFSSIYLKEGRASESLSYLRKAYEINPRDPGVLQNLSVVFIMLQNYPEARKICEMLISLKDKDEIVYNNLAFILLQQKEYDKAIENARKAIEIFPKYGDAHLNLARGYAAKGLKADATQEYANAKLLNPALQAAVDQELRAIR